MYDSELDRKYILMSAKYKPRKILEFSDYHNFCKQKLSALPYTCVTNKGKPETWFSLEIPTIFFVV